jgi:hypothetical protein
MTVVREKLGRVADKRGSKCKFEGWVEKEKAILC